ncbi:MAG: cytochrome c biogenesis protein CcsA [Bacteroidota bacterium]
MEYLNEHLLPGQIGHFLILLSFVSSLLAVLSYGMATNKLETPGHQSWRNIGRISFGIHGLSVFGIIGLIFFLMINQYYEYHYVWAHVSEDLPMRYIFSAFWEGQQGSFLLWMFWHAVLGFILLFNGGKWESPVLSILASIQLFIGSMLLGLYVGSGDDALRVGINPFVLLRDEMAAPIFTRSDYLEVVQGTGLNPLLQNYWMTIHPPTLFLGFAATAIPFCFAIAGLWTKDHKGWLKPALPWSLFCGAILGTGILMGGAWAYEALSFGGYWAWDPVENMSLVPWLILIAGIHTHLIAKATSHSIRSTYLFYLLSFVLIIYSTFLTRSGILGETSVHAFTEMGLEWQLVAFVGVFSLMSLVFFIARTRSIPVPQKEESTSSREFWMFIGSLVLLFSSALITASTSLPVYNKIMEWFDPMYLGGVINDPIDHYNKYQLWIAVFIGLLSGGTQYLRFREANWASHRRKFAKHLLISTGISAAFTVLLLQWIEANAWQYVLLLFTSVYTVISNVDYVVSFMRGNLKAAGSAVSHIGFGLMIIGTIASGLNKHHISKNEFAQRGLIEGFSAEDYQKNIVLLKGVPMLMSGYEVTYVGDTVDMYTREFLINYKKKDPSGTVVEEFNLSPNILYDKSFSKVAASNPSTKRYFNKDIFTHISSLPRAEIDPEFAKELEDSMKYETYNLNIGDTLFTTKAYAILESINRQPVHPDYVAEEGDVSVGVRLNFHKLGQDTSWMAEPVLVLRNNLLFYYPSQLNDLSLRVRLPEEVLDFVFKEDKLLSYQEYKLKRGESFRYNGHEFRFVNFNTETSHPEYTPQDGDIAVGAVLEIQPYESEETILSEPVYLIRSARQFDFKDIIPEHGIYVRFTGIDPKTEQVTLQIAQSENKGWTVPVEIAEGSRRADYIVMEAIVFPGINFFWVGSIMMMIGLFVSMFHRMQSKRKRTVAV